MDYQEDTTVYNIILHTISYDNSEELTGYNEMLIFDAIIISFSILLYLIVAVTILATKPLRRSSEYWILLSLCVSAFIYECLSLNDLLHHRYNLPIKGGCKVVSFLWHMVIEVFLISVAALVIQYVCIFAGRLRNNGQCCTNGKVDILCFKDNMPKMIQAAYCYLHKKQANA